MTGVARIDAQGNPLVHVTGCPNCGEGEGWITQIEYAGLMNAAVLGYGNRDPNRPCSRRCELQVDHARGLAQRQEWA